MVITVNVGVRSTPLCTNVIFLLSLPENCRGELHSPTGIIRAPSILPVSPPAGQASLPMDAQRCSAARVRPLVPLFRNELLRAANPDSFKIARQVRFVLFNVPFVQPPEPCARVSPALVAIDKFTLLVLITKLNHTLIAMPDSFPIGQAAGASVPVSQKADAHGAVHTARGNQFAFHGHTTCSVSSPASPCHFCMLPNDTR